MKKIEAFWDSSALVPLCVDQGGSTFAKADLKDKSLAVWWGASVEMTSAFTRLLRRGEISHDDFRAEKPLQQHPLRAADALQLAAALVWSKLHPRMRAFVCFDGRLAEAASKENFSVETV